MNFPFCINDLKNGSPDAIKWAKELTEQQLAKIEQECICCEEDSFLHEYYSVVCCIRNDSYDFGQHHFYALAKAAFYDEETDAQEEIAKTLGCSLEDEYMDADELAYTLWMNTCDGRCLAYALLLGITTEDARLLSDCDELESPWDYQNGDYEIVYRDLVETLLREDNERTRWKKSPRVVLQMLIKSGITHPGIPAFLEKYKDKKWAQNLIESQKKKQNREENGCCGLAILVVAAGCLLIYLLFRWFAS